MSLFSIKKKEGVGRRRGRKRTRKKNKGERDWKREKGEKEQKGILKITHKFIIIETDAILFRKPKRINFKLSEPRKQSIKFGG